MRYRCFVLVAIIVVVIIVIVIIVIIILVALAFVVLFIVVIIVVVFAVLEYRPFMRANGAIVPLASMWCGLSTISSRDLASSFSTAPTS